MHWGAGPVAGVEQLALCFKNTDCIVQAHYSLLRGSIPRQTRCWALAAWRHGWGWTGLSEVAPVPPPDAAYLLRCRSRRSPAWRRSCLQRYDAPGSPPEWQSTHNDHVNLKRYTSSSSQLLQLERRHPSCLPVKLQIGFYRWDIGATFGEIPSSMSSAKKHRKQNLTICKEGFFNVVFHLNTSHYYWSAH